MKQTATNVGLILFLTIFVGVFFTAFTGNVTGDLEELVKIGEPVYYIMVGLLVPFGLWLLWKESK